MKTILALFVGLFLQGCMMPDYWGTGAPVVYGYGYPYYAYPAYRYGGPPGFGWQGYPYGYRDARREDWRRWQAYQYGLSQGRNQPPPPRALPYGITPNSDGTYQVPGYGAVTPGQIQNWARKKRR